MKANTPTHWDILNITWFVNEDRQKYYIKSESEAELPKIIGTAKRKKKGSNRDSEEKNIFMQQAYISRKFRSCKKNFVLLNYQKKKEEGREFRKRWISTKILSMNE